MSRALLTMPIIITAVRFDAHGRAIPSRIDWGSRSIKLTARLEHGLLPFVHNGKYFWLRRNRYGWQIVSEF